MSNSLSRRLTYDCFGKITQQFASEGSLIYLLKLGSAFSRTKTFCFENSVFITLGLGIVRESVRAREVGKGVTPQNIS